MTTTMQIGPYDLGKTTYRIRRNGSIVGRDHGTLEQAQRFATLINLGNYEVIEIDQDGYGYRSWNF